MTCDEIIVANASRFTCDPETGVIACSGKVVGRQNNQGYFRVKIGRRDVQGHRLAWFLYHGVTPQGEIDHVNGNRADNRLCNLRDVEPSINRMNQRLRSDNTSGLPGVIYHSSNKRWVAQICVRGQRRQLGSFATREDAAAARIAAQSQLGFGPNHGVSQA